MSHRTKDAITKIQAIIIALVIIIAAIIATYYMLFPSQPTTKEELVLRMSQGDSIVTIDPAICYDYPSTITVEQAYDPLFMPSEEPPYDPIPWVVESYNVSADGLIYTMKIRSGLKFHDGTEVTAEDVAFTMDRYLSIKKGHSGFWIGFIAVGNTTALDKYTVRFNLTKPSNAFIPSLTKFFVMNKKLLLQNKAEGPFGDYGDLGQAWISQGHDAGSGPYMIVSYSPDIGAELVKFNDYWKGWKPNQVDRIKFMVITEEATIKMLLMNKELEMGHAFLSPTTYLTLGNIAYLNLSYGPSINWEPICINTRRPPLDDVHVRRAIAYAINYTDLVNTVFPGAIVGSSLLAPGVFGHDPSIPKFEMNLTKAEEELDQSSYTREQLSQFTLECHWLSGQDADRMVAVALQSACARIGINVEVVSVLWSQMLDRATNPQTTPHFSIWEPWSRYPDPDYYVYSAFHSSQQGRWITQHWFFTDELDALCVLQRSTLNSTERQIALKQIQQIVRDNIPIIFVCYRPYYNIRQNYVQGWKYIPYHAWEYWIYRLTIVR